MVDPWTLGPRDRRLATPLDMGGGVARIAQARAALWLERAWPQLRLVLLLLGAYAGLALLGAFTAFAPGARVGLLLLLIAGLCMLGRRILKTVPWPGERAAIARLELQSGLPRGLLQLARDVPALEGEPGLWRIGKRLSLAAWARPLRLGMRLDCVTGDRYGFGTAAVLLLALGLLVAGPRLASGCVRRFCRPPLCWEMSSSRCGLCRPRTRVVRRSS
ncbi:DUF4175 domain-containing protein [Hankyongella ginsenosidimutans]|uniref:DUF4175 domain-containing protein n=1 Tax=Hankyongella ginsenosidimutans TaxID=1763828 RepID=A0A4D7C502_9SPHN|nr:DUF4175 domain-containing protein [Hankyongella ginsenosidimutans]